MSNTEKLDNARAQALIKVKQTALPPSGAHWSYGSDYMRGISKASSKALCGMYPLPAVGYETVVAIAPDGYGGFFRLYVKNIGGQFFLSSTTISVDQWPEIFKVEVIEQ